MGNSLRYYHIPIFIPDYGCPFRCVFCNQKTITSTVAIPTLSEVQAHIDIWLNTIPLTDSHIEIAFFGGNFTGIPEAAQIAYLEAAYPYIQQGKVHSIRLSTRPDAISEEILLRLKRFGVQTIELGAQSMSDKVLLAVGRGHTAEDTIRASALILKHGFTLGLQMMVGLPGDDAETALETARQIIDLGAHETRIYPLLVIKNTELENQYHRGLYTPLTLEEAVKQTAPIYELFEKHGVTILKVGLHPSEGFNSGETLVAGPYHPNFRELVLSKIWSNRLEKKLAKWDSDRKIQITVNPQDINAVVGFGGVNKKALQSRFGEVMYIQNSAIPKGKYRISEG
jgi:histone acetyltransferase (RNA polymerase elongator complex component)